MMQAEREYAEALLLVAGEEGKVQEYLACLKEIGTIIGENPEYLDLLSSPAISMAERLSLIDEAFATAPENIVSFLKLLCENDRIPLLAPAILEYEKMVHALEGVVEAKVFFAHPLTEEQKASLCAKLSLLSGKTVEPVYVHAPELIGGVKVEMDGKTFDGSIKKSLQDVKDVMNG